MVKDLRFCRFSISIHCFLYMRIANGSTKRWAICLAICIWEHKIHLILTFNITHDIIPTTLQFPSIIHRCTSPYPYSTPSTLHPLTAASPPTLLTAPLPPSIHPTPLIPSLCAFSTLTLVPGFPTLHTQISPSRPPLTALFSFSLPPSKDSQDIDVTRPVWALQREMATSQEEVS